MPARLLLGKVRPLVFSCEFLNRLPKTTRLISKNRGTNSPLSLKRLFFMASLEISLSNSRIVMEKRANSTQLLRASFRGSNVDMNRPKATGVASNTRDICDSFHVWLVKERVLNQRHWLSQSTASIFLKFVRCLLEIRPSS